MVIFPSPQKGEDGGRAVQGDGRSCDLDVK